MPLPLSFHFILLAIHLFFPPLGLSEPKTMYRMRWDGTKWHSWGGVRRCPTFPNALPFSPPCPSTPGSGSSDDKENKIFLVWFYGIYAIFLIASVLLFLLKLLLSWRPDSLLCLCPIMMNCIYALFIQHILTESLLGNSEQMTLHGSVNVYTRRRTAYGFPSIYEGVSSRIKDPRILMAITFWLFADSLFFRKCSQPRLV